MGLKRAELGHFHFSYVDLTIKKTNVNVLLGTARSIPFILCLLCIGYIEILLRKNVLSFLC